MERAGAPWVHREISGCISWPEARPTGPAPPGPAVGSSRYLNLAGDGRIRRQAEGLARLVFAAAHRSAAGSIHRLGSRRGGRRRRGVAAKAARGGGGSQDGEDLVQRRAAVGPRHGSADGAEKLGALAARQALAAAARE